MFCEKCGSKLVDGALFCTTCGTPARKAETEEIKEVETVNKEKEAHVGAPVQTAQTNVQESAQKTAATVKNMFSNKKFLITLGIIAAAAVVAIVLIVNAVTNTPEGIVQKYLDAVKNGNSQAAMECYVTPGVAFDDYYADTFSYILPYEADFTGLTSRTITETYRSAYLEDTMAIQMELLEEYGFNANVFEIAVIEVDYRLLMDELDWYEFTCVNVNGQWKLVEVY